MHTFVLPKTIKEKVRIFGPGFVWAAAAIGSGELIISTKIGSEYGLMFIWALWVGIWLKYWIQRGILDISILTGKPIVEVWHQGRFGRLSSWYWLLFFILTVTGVAGLIGLSASILTILIPFLSITVSAVIVTFLIIGIGYIHRYEYFEKIMLSLCLVLGVGTLFTLFFSHPTPLALVEWGIPTTMAGALVFLSLLGWGAGSGPDLMVPYSWWVTEKGYQNLDVRHQRKEALMQLHDEESISKIKKWLAFAKWDVILGYLAAGIVASVFMIAGSEILRPLGITVDGLSVLQRLSNIFTETFGSWSYLLFMIPAFAALFSTALGVFDGGRISIAHLLRLLARKKTIPADHIRGNVWYRITLVLFSVVPLGIFLGVQKPVLLVIIASIISALAMPLLAWQTLWSLLKDIPKEYRPSRFYISNLALSILVYLFFMGQALFGVLVK
jgi:Mn2+/Fe2+ NRAMP family transporter